MQTLSYSLLFDEHPITISPKLAELLGLDAAVFIQQVHYFVTVKKRFPEQNKNHYNDGHWWVYNTVKQWHKEFPYLGSTRKIERLIKSLEEKCILISSTFNKFGADKTKWYRINYEQLYALCKPKRVFPTDKMAGPYRQNGGSSTDKMAEPITKDFPKTSNKDNNIPVSDKPKRNKYEYSESFEKFWKSYPNRKEKIQAFKAWKQLKPSNELEQTIAEDIQWKKSNSSEWLGGCIIYPERYLKRRRWEDERETTLDTKSDKVNELKERRPEFNNNWKWLRECFKNEVILKYEDLKVKITRLINNQGVVLIYRDHFGDISEKYMEYNTPLIQMPEITEWDKTDG